MLDQKLRLLKYLNKLQKQVQLLSEEELLFKKGPSKWSKKEIIGHLIDSSNANIRRFNEIQFMASPYKMEKYAQDKLVQSNSYQVKDSKELILLLTALVDHIAFLMEHCLEAFSHQELSIDGEIATLNYLVTDYVDHFIHHVNQIS